MAAALNAIARKRESPLGGLLFHLYRWRPLRPLIRVMLGRLEGGIMLSITLRRIYKAYEDVVVGDYSRGLGIQPGRFANGTEIGRFSCIADGFRALRRNHTIDRPSQHPLFFNHILGLLEQDSIPEHTDNPLSIGSDVWIGLNVTVCPGCARIGDGAIIGAGSVVTADVEPYSIMAGNPARLIRMRYEPAVADVIAASKWWLRPLPDLVRHMDLFTGEITTENMDRFAAAFPPAGTHGDKIP